MSFVSSGRRKSIYGGCIFIALLLTTNFLAQRLEWSGPVKPVTVWAAVIDVMMILPIVLFLFVLRRKPNLSVLAPLWLIGALFIHWIVPDYAKENLLFFNTAIIIVEAAFFLMEVILLLYLLRKYPIWIRNFKDSHVTYPHLMARIAAANQKTFHNSITGSFGRVIQFLAADLSAIRYAFFPHLDHTPSHAYSFSYHKKSEYFGVFIMLIHAMLVEIIAVHVLLMQYSHTAAWIAAIIDIYGLVFLIGDYQAVRKSPIIIDDKNVHLQKGLRFSMTLPIEMIRYVRPFSAKDEQGVPGTYNMTLSGLEERDPQIVMELKEGVEGERFFGRKREVHRLFITVDNPAGFIAALKEKEVVSTESF
ncbi:hypothetical protein [Halobacillus litoralis]|uniref:hypothetical protein n=1 Tax=Halobacillus litoralis TaxID=45668 RepID=UPI001CFE8F5E|nr:hypothetical protein [Halobacillus litoralis]